jgi:nucleotide-binding universal stress UspA family protein
MLDSHHILFPIDFSSRSRAVIPFVKSMAQRLGSKVTLLYAIQIPANVYAMEQVIPVTVDAEQTEDKARREMLNFYQPDEGEDFATVAETGDPACVITRYARLNQPLMIMMATHGYGKFRSLLLGSVAAKVLHDTPFPVWTAAHTEDPALPSHACCEKILCAVSLDESSLPLVRQAADFAARTGATLRLVHGVPVVAVDVDAAPGPAYQDLLLQTAHEQMVKLQKEAGTNFEVSVGPWPPGQMIRETAIQQGSDLVIVGRGHLHEGLGRLRSEAYGIIHQSPCPVLSY